MTIGRQWSCLYVGSYRAEFDDLKLLSLIKFFNDLFARKVHGHTKHTFEILGQDTASVVSLIISLLQTKYVTDHITEYFLF